MPFVAFLSVRAVRRHAGWSITCYSRIFRVSQVNKQYFLCIGMIFCLIISFSGSLNRFSTLPPSDLSEQTLSPPPKQFSSMTAYNNVKLCNVLFARGLAKVTLIVARIKCFTILTTFNFLRRNCAEKGFAWMHYIRVTWCHRHYRGIGGSIV